jgi:Ribosomal protein S16
MPRKGRKTIFGGILLWLRFVCAAWAPRRLLSTALLSLTSRFARDGRFIEEIGYYDPTKEPSVV